MKILVIGSGGREHAIARKLGKSDLVEKIYCAPGNGGTQIEDKCENVALNSNDEYVAFAKENNVNITVVGPEAPLVEGIADRFEEEGLKILGPHKKAAMLEGSKAFAKDFMKKHGVKTAAYEVFEDSDKAKAYLEECAYPTVVKADGLAAGKGVVICENKEQAIEAIDEIMVKDVFKGAGSTIVVEEFLEGVEASILSITDGKTIIPFISSKDHKQIYDGDKGPNTGGMGVIAPNPYCTDKVLANFEKDIMNPTLEGIKADKLEFSGIIFFGLMIKDEETYLLEYNMRMGDPETQVVLELMESDFMTVVEKAVDKKLSEVTMQWKDEAACCVVGAAPGYPASYPKGLEIKGYKDNKNDVIIAGGVFKEGALLTSGGRVLASVSTHKQLDEAISKAYSVLDDVKFEGMYTRRDIGKI